MTPLHRNFSKFEFREEQEVLPGFYNGGLPEIIFGSISK